VKITKSILKQLIKEELTKLNERTPLSKDYQGDRTFSYDKKRGKRAVPGVDDWVGARSGEDESRRQTQRAGQSDPAVVDTLKRAEQEIEAAQMAIAGLLDKIEGGSILPAASSGEGINMAGGGGGDIEGIIHLLRRAEFNLKKAQPQ
jgi:hypothetical protein